MWIGLLWLSFEISTAAVGAIEKKSELGPTSNSLLEFVLYMPVVRGTLTSFPSVKFHFDPFILISKSMWQLFLLSLLPPLCCFFETQGWRVRKPGCNKPVTDGTSLRHRQEDLWQGPDADIKSQEMCCASPIATSPFCRSQSPPSSLCCFLSFLVTLSLHNAFFHIHFSLRIPRCSLSVIAISSSLPPLRTLVGLLGNIVCKYRGGRY